MNISIFTSMTKPEERNDPWSEALECYRDLADEVIIVGEKWPDEFSFELIGEVFQEGFDKSQGDWVIHMDIDNFFHEKDIHKLKKALRKYKNEPAVSFPKYQIFTPDRFHLKAKMCIALNKKLFPNILMNGGGDICQPTIQGKLLDPTNTPYARVPIWNYDTVFRTKEIIAKDRARFARAWYRYFNDWGDRGGGSPEEAYAAWFEMIKQRYKKHIIKLKIEDHPKYIMNKLKTLSYGQFGYDGFGLKNQRKENLPNVVQAHLEFYYNNFWK